MTWTAQLSTRSNPQALQFALPETRKVFAAHGVVLNGQRTILALGLPPAERDRFLRDLFEVLSQRLRLHQEARPYVCCSCPDCLRRYGVEPAETEDNPTWIELALSAPASLQAEPVLIAA